MNSRISEFKNGSIVTDLSSVKSDIIEGIRPALCSKGVHFIGGHPMAGTEKTGMEFADSEIYKDKVIFLLHFVLTIPPLYQ